MIFTTKPLKFAFIVMSAVDYPEGMRRGKFHEYGDVFLLTWKAPYRAPTNGVVKDSVYHNGSWAESRNFIFQYIISNYGNQYDYYIFMDDDISLEYNAPNRFTHSLYFSRIGKRSSDTPLSIFLRFLRHYQPAMACAVNHDYRSWRGLREHVTAIFKFQKGSLTRIFREFRKSWKHVSAILRLDHGFSAFHKDAICNLFPYTTVFDNESWYYASYTMTRIATVIYSKHVLQFNPVQHVNGSAPIRYTQQDLLQSTATQRLIINKEYETYAQRLQNWNAPYDYIFSQIKDEHKYLIANDDKLSLYPNIKTVSRKNIDYKTSRPELYLHSGDLIDRRNAYYAHFPADYRATHIN